MTTAPARTPYALLLAVLCPLNTGGLFAPDINLPGVPATAHALANSIAAVDTGATWIDSSVLGMGKGPGNLASA